MYTAKHSENIIQQDFFNVGAAKKFWMTKMQSKYSELKKTKTNIRCTHTTSDKKEGNLRNIYDEKKYLEVIKRLRFIYNQRFILCINSYVSTINSILYLSYPM